MDKTVISIHPGVVGGRRVHDLETSTKPYKSGGGKLFKKQRRLNIRQMAWNSTIKSAGVDAAAFIKPNSMKTK